MTFHMSIECSAFTFQSCQQMSGMKSWRGSRSVHVRCFQKELVVRVGVPLPAAASLDGV